MPLSPRSAISASGLQGPAWSGARAEQAEGAGRGELDAEHGRVCAAGRGGLVVVLVAENRVNVGLVRVEMLRALEAFA